MNNQINNIENKPNNTDKRYLPRWDVSNRVLFQIEDNESKHEACTKDINLTGACILSKSNIDPNEKIELTIFLSDKAFVKIKGSVLWAKPQDDETVKAGVHFDLISEESQDLIYQHAFEIERKQIVNNWFKGWDRNQLQTNN